MNRAGLVDADDAEKAPPRLKKPNSVPFFGGSAFSFSFSLVSEEADDAEVETESASPGVGFAPKKDEIVEVLPF